MWYKFKRGNLLHFNNAYLQKLLFMNVTFFLVSSSFIKIKDKFYHNQFVRFGLKASLLITNINNDKNNKSTKKLQESNVLRYNFTIKGHVKRISRYSKLDVRPDKWRLETIHLAPESWLKNDAHSSSTLRVYGRLTDARLYNLARVKIWKILLGLKTGITTSSVLWYGFAISISSFEVGYKKYFNLIFYKLVFHIYF